MPNHRIAIVHFLPLELYPPVMNLLDVASTDSSFNAYFDVYTTHNSVGRRKFEPKSSRISIRRFGLGRTDGRLKRGLHYCLYYFRVLFGLIVTKPLSVLYYDSISSFPAVVYKKYINRNVRLFVHYHEYMSPEEYERGMVMLKCFHKIERRVLPMATWISHTNRSRMDLFARNMMQYQIQCGEVLPNFPPESWNVRIGSRKERDIVRFVQVGTIGVDTMYVKEFAGWIFSMNGRAVWDIFSFSMDQKTRDYFTKLNCPWITLKDPVDYNDLPEVLANYDVGVILYKGHIPNYVFNAPNKLFEYHVCGLDVWFPNHMLSAREYETTSTYPKIISVDFSRLPESLMIYSDWQQLEFERKRFSATDIYVPFVNKLCSVSGYDAD